MIIDWQVLTPFQNVVVLAFLNTYIYMAIHLLYIRLCLDIAKYMYLEKLKQPTV